MFQIIRKLLSMIGLYRMSFMKHVLNIITWRSICMSVVIPPNVRQLSGNCLSMFQLSENCCPWSVYIECLSWNIVPWSGNQSPEVQQSGISRGRSAHMHIMSIAASSARFASYPREGEAHKFEVFNRLSNKLLTATSNLKNAKQRFVLQRLFLGNCKRSF